MSSRLDIAAILEKTGHAKAAQQMRDYDAACNALGTTATMAAREAPELAAMLDELDEQDPDHVHMVPTMTWLMEQAMVAIWKASKK